MLLHSRSPKTCQQLTTSANYLLQVGFHHISVYYRPQRSCGKVMCSQASVILPTGGGVCGRPPRTDTPPCPVHAGIHTHTLPSACWDTRPYPAASSADGTHPTGMHSCFQIRIQGFVSAESCLMFVRACSH